LISGLPQKGTRFSPLLSRHTGCLRIIFFTTCFSDCAGAVPQLDRVPLPHRFVQITQESLLPPSLRSVNKHLRKAATSLHGPNNYMAVAELFLLSGGSDPVPLAPYPFTPVFEASIRQGILSHFSLLQSYFVISCPRFFNCWDTRNVIISFHTAGLGCFMFFPCTSFPSRPCVLSEFRLSSHPGCRWRRPHVAFCCLRPSFVPFNPSRTCYTGTPTTPRFLC